MAFPRNQRILCLLPLALILATALYATAFWVFAPGLNPSPGDYVQAADIIRSNWKNQDAVVIRPWWAARIRQHVGDLAFVQVRDLQAEDWSRYARLWVVLLPGSDDGLRDTFTLETERDAGRLTVRRYRLPDPALVRFDFRQHLRRATVHMHQGSGAKPCSKWVENRWVCSGRDWNYVGQMIVELGDDPRAIIWAHPSDSGPLEITYPNVPGGQTLLVHTGLTPPAARTPGGSPVTLEILFNGRELGKAVQAASQTGYFPTRWDIGDLGPGPHTVTFRVHSPNIGMRHFCFDGQVRG